jgi:hypothetical protein
MATSWLAHGYQKLLVGNRESCSGLRPICGFKSLGHGGRCKEPRLNNGAWARNLSAHEFRAVIVAPLSEPRTPTLLARERPLS